MFSALACTFLFACAFLATSRHAVAQAISQDRSASRLHELVRGLTATPRVLLIGAHPDDEDTNLIVWLSRGRSIETAYLSLTRGESGRNLLGDDLGTSLGAVRVQEMLAARRVDGASQFFTRAFDFGFSRNAADAFGRWNRAALLGDVVAVIRSFRPHVVVISTQSGAAGDKGQREALGALARQAFEAAGDPKWFPSPGYGSAWRALKLYEAGPGIVIDAAEFDPVLGKTYAELAVESRLQRRVSGLSTGTPGTGRTQLARIDSLVNRQGDLTAERTLFDGIDTSFARLAQGAPDGIPADVSRIVAYADSARAALHVARPGGVVPYLARAAQLAAHVRARAPACGHPSVDAGARSAFVRRCDQRQLDLDASIDLVTRRSVEALLIAAGVVIEARSDRELVAPGDDAAVTVTVRNHGSEPVAILDVAVSGAPRSPMAPLEIRPGGAGREPNDGERIVRAVPGRSVAYARPWWIGQRHADLFPPTAAYIDGLDRSDEVASAVPTVTGAAVPEGIRRMTDVTVTLTVAGATLTTSLGPILYRHEEPRVGVQERPMGGVPAVTLAFDRGLEWVRARKPLGGQLQLTARSFSDSAQTFDLVVVAPKGVRVDPAPARVTLAPREQRELFLRLRGMLDTGRYQFGTVGEPGRGDRFVVGFRTTQYPHLPPIRSFRGSGLWLQSVQVEAPPGLTVAYIAGASQDRGIAAALRSIGVRVVTASPEELPLLDLSRFSTVVVGTHAYDEHPSLIAQNPRLLGFARAGGTLVVLAQERATPSVVPYPVTLASPLPERVAAADAPVTVLDARARVLRWPNPIRRDDWTGWVQERAIFVPTTADGRYSTVIEMHDEGEPANPNALLVARLGSGTYVHSTISFFRQIPGGVPGSLRLFVNLLSAGLQ